MKLKKEKNNIILLKTIINESICEPLFKIALSFFFTSTKLKEMKKMTFIINSCFHQLLKFYKYELKMHSRVTSLGNDIRLLESPYLNFKRNMIHRNRIEISKTHWTFSFYSKIYSFRKKAKQKNLTKNKPNWDTQNC